jgi:hypothetical protein
MGEATTAMPRRTGVNAWVVYWEVMPGGPLPIARMRWSPCYRLGGAMRAYARFLSGFS